jgi:hypothetical protein
VGEKKRKKGDESQQCGCSREESLNLLSFGKNPPRATQKIITAPNSDSGNKGPTEEALTGETSGLLYRYYTFLCLRKFLFYFVFKGS